MAQKKEKKTDYRALQSPFMQIPRMKTEVARYLLDAGFNYIDELQGRAPETIMSEIKKVKADVPADVLHYIRMAVYFAETPSPEGHKLHPHAWAD